MSDDAKVAINQLKALNEFGMGFVVLASKAIKDGAPGATVAHYTLSQSAALVVNAGMGRDEFIKLAAERYDYAVTVESRHKASLN